MEKEIKQNNVSKRQFNGEVVSVAENKTIHVRVEDIKTNSKYHKQYATHKKYPVHDEKGEAKLGNLVLFEECRPFSRTKRWRLIKIVK